MYDVIQQMKGTFKVLSFYSRKMQGLVWTIKSQYIFIGGRNYEDVWKKTDTYRRSEKQKEADEDPG